MASCDICRKPYGIEPFLEVENQTLCSACFRSSYTCPGCGQQIAGQYCLQPNTNNRWHPVCFQKVFPPMPCCAECGKTFSATELAYDVSGRKLCYSCSQFAIQFACAGCGEIIRDAYIPVNNLKYHKACFDKLQNKLFCNSCKRPFGDDPYVEVDGKCLCDNCFRKQFSCHKCGKKITGALVEADGEKYHPECAVVPLCGGCNQPIVAGEYIVLDGRKWHTKCKGLYNQRQTVERFLGHGPGTKTCIKCKQPIIGEYVILSGADYHPECFGTGQRHHNLTSGPGYGRYKK